MSRVYLLWALLPIFVNALAIGATNETALETNIVDGAFIVECSSLGDVESLSREIQTMGGTIRYNFTSDTFLGLSAQLPRGSDGKASSSFSSELKAKSGVKKVWPVETVTRSVDKAEQVEKVHGDLQRRRRRRATDGKAPWNHVMTQVDKLHAEGYSGKGIKIGVVDVGVNYTVKALGGCFGPGCRVAFGAGFRTGQPPGPPFIDGLTGHGTKVASILAGYSKEDGFVGAAPNATIGAYTIAHELNYAEDSTIAAWLQAEKDGMQIIASSFGIQGGNWAQRPTALVVSRLVAKGIPCVVGIGNENNRGMFNVMNPSSGRGVVSVNSFTKEGYRATLSAAGPTAELDIKPQVGAPGESVPLVFGDGSYGVDSGTSFAGPLVAGIMALIAEARGAFDPALLESLLVSTAEPQGGDPKYSVTFQGGGLVQAWDAAHATTLVQPASLAFNDTDHRVPKLSLKITNTAKSDVKYELSTVAAESAYTMGIFGLGKHDETIAVSAQIKLSQSSFTLKPGQSTSVDVSASDPEKVDLSRLPVWSGYVKIHESGSSGKTLTIPYLGVAGSLRSIQLFGLMSHVSVRNWERPEVWRFEKILDTPVVVADPPLTKERPGRIDNFEGPEKTFHNSPIAFFELLIGTPRIEVHLIPLDICPKEANEKLTITKACVPESSLVDVTGMQAFHFESIKSLGIIADYEHDYRGGGRWENGFVFNGLLESGEYAPPGRYKFAARALSIFGDANNDADWQMTQTYPFTFGYESNLKA